MTPEDEKTIKIMFATFKFDIAEIIEKKVDELLKEKNKHRTYIERGYRE